MKYCTNEDYDHHDIELGDVVELDDDYRSYEIIKVFNNGKVKLQNVENIHDKATTHEASEIYLSQKAD